MGFTTEELNTTIESQLETWPLARDNFFRLMQAKRKVLPSWSLQCTAQLNPARIISTGAKTDAESISKRPCFLCRAYRPAEQEVTTWNNPVLRDWELLVNPYPILPVHFTVAHRCHIPQASIPPEMAAMAEEARDLVFFFNGARAGASAPDHLHVQGVLAYELPLMKLVEEIHPPKAGPVLHSDETGLALPFHFTSLVITPDESGAGLMARACASFGIDADTGLPDRGLLNAFFRIDPSGLLRIVIVPRRRHRPLCFGHGENDFMISPGAIDMAGLIITPREMDFTRIDSACAAKIYDDVAFSDKIPEQIKSFFNE